MPLPTGSWASALGAAITGAQQGFQQGKTQQQENLLRAIQMQLAQDQVNELPKQHAEQDANIILNRAGIGAFSDPTFVKANQVAGVPLPVATPGTTNAAPGTEVQIPTQYVADEAARQQALGLNQARLDFIRKANGMGSAPTPDATSVPQPAANGPVPFSFTPQAPGAAPAANPTLKPSTAPTGDDPAFPNGVKSYLNQIRLKYGTDLQGAQNELQQAWPSIAAAHPNVDPIAVMKGLQSTMSGDNTAPPFYDQQQVAQHTMGKLTGLMDAPLQESDAHKLWMQKQELDNKARYKPPAQAMEKEIDAYKKARIVMPQLREALTSEVLNPADPTGQNANPVTMAAHLAKQKMKAAAYSAGYPLSDADSKAQQLAGMLKVIGATPYMNGSRSLQMFNQVADHLTDRGMAPEAQLQRLNELESIFPQFEHEIGYHTPDLPPTMATPGHTPSAAPPAVPRLVDPKQPVSATEAVAAANAAGLDPMQYLAQLKSAGVTVVK